MSLLERFEYRENLRPLQLHFVTRGMSIAVYFSQVSLVSVGVGVVPFFPLQPIQGQSFAYT